MNNDSLPEPYKCDVCNYHTFVKKSKKSKKIKNNLYWHNSTESHLSRVRHSKPTAIFIFQDVKKIIK